MDFVEQNIYLKIESYYLKESKLAYQFKKKNQAYVCDNLVKLYKNALKFKAHLLSFLLFIGKWKHFLKNYFKSASHNAFVCDTIFMWSGFKLFLSF